jgi:hypothetical protein
VTPAVCTEYDLLVVFPWALSNVVSGSPKLFQPYVVGARFAAEYRNWHWTHKRTSRRDKTVRLSAVTNHYPTKSELIADRAVHDDGKNFGRIARTDLMNEYIAELFGQTLAGIPLDAWQRFFRAFTESDPQERVGRLADQLAREAASVREPATAQDIEAIKTRLQEIAALLS